MRELGGPFAAGLLDDFELPTVTQKAASPGLDVKWEAHLDTLRIRHEPVRVYRLQTQVLGRYPIVIYISREGEILRAELPGGIVLVDDLLQTSNGLQR